MSESVVVQGYAGSGKSTHCDRLSQNYLYNGEPIAHASRCVNNVSKTKVL